MNYDFVRGVLILIVILDHNDLVRNVRAVNQWFLPMTFHVAGFLLLPFLVSAKTLNAKMAADHAIRYLTPFVFALLLYSVAFHLVVAPGMPFGDWLLHLATAAIFASPDTLHKATGFIVLWFLPTLLTLVLLSAAYNAASPVWRSFILGISLTAHLGIGGVSQEAKSMVPQGLLIALYIFPLGLACRRLIPWLASSKRSVLLIGLSLAVLLACWKSECGAEIEIATLVVPTLLHPLRVLATDISDIAFLTLLVVASQSLGSAPVLTSLGRFSLVVYLVHPLIYKPVLGELLRFSTPGLLSRPGGPAIYWFVGFASVAIVTAASLVVAAGIEAWPVSRKLVTPRGRDDWFVLSLWSRFAQRQTA